MSISLAVEQVSVALVHTTYKTECGYIGIQGCAFDGKSFIHRLSTSSKNIQKKLTFKRTATNNKGYDAILLDMGFVDEPNSEVFTSSSKSSKDSKEKYEGIQMIAQSWPNLGLPAITLNQEDSIAGTDQAQASKLSSESLPTITPTAPSPSSNSASVSPSPLSTQLQALDGVQTLEIGKSPDSSAHMSQGPLAYTGMNKICQKGGCLFLFFTGFLSIWKQILGVTGKRNTVPIASRLI